jgi:hypothetical protein
MSEFEMNQDDYKELIDAMRKDKAKQKVFWSPPGDKEGTYKIRFLPPVKKNNEKVFYFHHKVHWINGKGYECLNQTLIDKDGNLHEAEECPICSAVSKLYATAEKGSDDYKLAGMLKAKDRYIYRIIIRGNPDETKIEYFESGKKLFELLYHILTESDFGMIIDLKNGRDFSLVKVGTGAQSNYDTSTPSANVSMIFNDKESIAKLLKNLEEAPKFNSFVEFKDAQTLKQTLKKFLTHSDEDEEEDELIANFENSEKVQQPVEKKVEKVAATVTSAKAQKVEKNKPQVIDTSDLVKDDEEEQEPDEIDKLLDMFNS